MIHRSESNTYNIMYELHTKQTFGNIIQNAISRFFISRPFAYVYASQIGGSHFAFGEDTMPMFLAILEIPFVHIAIAVADCP